MKVDRGELWSVIRDAAVQGSHAGERYGTDAFYGIEDMNIRLDAVASEYANRIADAIESARTPMPPPLPVAPPDLIVI